MARYSRLKRRRWWRKFKKSVSSFVTDKIGVDNLAKFAFIGVVAGTVLMVFLFFWFSRDLPNPNTIVRDKGFSTQILDREGEKVLYDVYEQQNRQFTPLEEMPKDLRNATVAIEDKDFYKHEGFYLPGMIRGFSRIFTRGRAQGGSTLTQQLVKNVLLTHERTVSRKIKELVLAVQIERKFSKDQILQMYLNEAPYGGTAWGIASASEMYFGKNPADLSLTESVFLAGMPQAPSRYSPYGNNDKAYVARAKNVARRMREDGYITEEKENEIVENLPEIEFEDRDSTLKAPHFVMYVRDQLEEMFGEAMVSGGGLKVTTTLDWELHEKAEEIVESEIDKVSESLHITNGSSVMIDPQTGEILSMVGSKDFFDEDIDGQVNVALRPRQPGSSIKPVTYAAAFEEGFWPGKVFADVVTEFPSGDSDKPYRPENYDGTENGLVHLREALSSSLNVVAVKLLAKVGVEDMLETAYRMGIDTLEPSKENLRRLGLSVTLGGGEVRLLDMSAAYSSFANGGYKVEPVSILKVEDRDGEVLYEKNELNRPRVLDEEVAFLINDILSDNQARLLTFGPNSLINIAGRDVAVKTGTTNDLRDNWTVGWSKNALVGVWVGNNDNSSMRQVASGVSGASPIWRRQMLEALTKRGDEPFTPPGGVREVELDRISGYPAHDGFLSYKEWVVNGTLPVQEDPIHKMTKVCNGQPDRLATEVQIARGDYETAEYIYVREEDPLTNEDLWQKAINGWLESVDDERYHPPTEYCGEGGVHVEIDSPSDDSRVNGNDVNIKTVVYADKEIEWVDLYIDGNKEWRWEDRPFERVFTLSDGYHEIRVVARITGGTESERVHTFTVNEEYQEPTPSPTPTTEESTESASL